MSIRKPSATTDRPALATTEGAFRYENHRRLAMWGIGIAMSLVVLAGCAEGTSQDAERGKLEDAQRTSVVSDLQATRSAQVMNPGTPPPPTEIATELP